MAFGAESDDGMAQARILAELEAVFRAPEFERAPVMRRLLSFLVKTTLSGRGDELKAYSVAVDGLGRDPDFDSQSDSYPRVQVGRLRKMLDAHYAHNAPDDGMRLLIRSGGYRVDLARAEDVPAVRWQPPAPDVTPLVERSGRLLTDGLRLSPPIGLSSGFPWRLALAGGLLLAALGVLIWIVQRTTNIDVAERSVAQAPVLALGDITSTDGPAASALAIATQTVLDDALHRTWLIRVRRNPAPQQAIAPVEQPVYQLTGHVDTTGVSSGPLITLTLRDLRSGDQLWSQSIDAPVSGTSLTETLRPAITALIGPFGVIATHQRGIFRAAGQPGYACLLDYDSYYRHREATKAQGIHGCVAATIEREPMNAPALAAASFLAFDTTLGGRADNARAAELARRAVAANPYSADAQAADARVAFVNGQCARGKTIANRALALNPYSPELSGLMGFLLYQCDDLDAVPLLHEAITLDPDVPTFYSAGLMLALIDQGRTQEALNVAETIRPPGPGMAAQYAISQAIAAAARHDIAGGRAFWATIVTLTPAPKTTPDQVLAHYFYSPSFRAKLLDYFGTSGIIGTPVATAPGS